jgi:hypothetical protein
VGRSSRVNTDIFGLGLVLLRLHRRLPSKSCRPVQTAIALPLGLPAPYNIAEVRYGLTAAPVVGTGSGGAYMGVQLQGDIVPTGYKCVSTIIPERATAVDGHRGAL